MTGYLASLFAFAGLLAGRIASPGDAEWVGWRDAADDSIIAGQEWADAWRERKTKKEN